MTSTADICIIEPNADDRRAFVQPLELAGYRVVQAGSAEEGLELIRAVKPRVVLCEWALPGCDGMEICARAKQGDGGCDPYFVLIACTDDVQRKAEALETGADDYLTKPCHPRELAARVHVGMRIWGLQQKLHQAAVTDGLTGLWTHQHFAAVLEAEFARTRRYGGHLSLVMCDLDRFKAINDSFGHLTGNAVLRQVANVLRRAVRQIDLPVRYGGEEFAVLVPEVDLPEVARMAERLRMLIEQSVHIDGHEDVAVTASIGVSSAGDPQVITPEDLVGLADRAMYLAKRRGGNRVCTSEHLKREDPFSDDMCEDMIGELRRQVASLSLKARETYVQGIWALVQALEARDPCTACHSRNVTAYAEAIARGMCLTDSMRLVVRNAAMLHDIGKIGVPDRLLLKRGRLTAQEREILRRVPMLSARIIDHMRILDAEVTIIRHQQEHFDGSGHPHGLVGDAIPLGSRIIHVANAFDAMTTNRAYRRHLSIDRALDELRAGAGKQFDPAVVDTMVSVTVKNRDAWQQRISAALKASRSAGPSFAASV